MPFFRFTLLPLILLPVPVLAQVNADYGDLPNLTTTGAAIAYPTTLADSGPYHHPSQKLHLGSQLDYETDGQPSPFADADDLAAIDDEDGITLPAALKAGQSTTFEASVTNDHSTPAYLHGFIDWNGNGTCTADGMNYDPRTSLDLIDWSNPALPTFNPTDYEWTTWLLPDAEKAFFRMQIARD